MAALSSLVACRAFAKSIMACSAFPSSIIGGTPSQGKYKFGIYSSSVFDFFSTMLRIRTERMRRLIVSVTFWLGVGVLMQNFRFKPKKLLHPGGGG